MDQDEVDHDEVDKKFWSDYKRLDEQIKRAREKQWEIVWKEMKKLEDEKNELEIQLNATTKENQILKAKLAFIYKESQFDEV